MRAMVRRLEREIVDEADNRVQAPMLEMLSHIASFESRIEPVRRTLFTSSPRRDADNDDNDDTVEWAFGDITIEAIEDQTSVNTSTENNPPSDISNSDIFNNTHSESYNDNNMSEYTLLVPNDDNTSDIDEEDSIMYYLPNLRVPISLRGLNFSFSTSDEILALQQRED